MKVVVAIDSLKGSLTSLEAGNAISEGVLSVYPDAEVVTFPVADGGEGTVEALVNGMGGELREVVVKNPIGNPVKAHYGVVGDIVVIEMASAAGLTLIKDSERNPLHTTTYGVGEIIKDAVLKGYREFIIGIGGSATNDGGIGMLQALNFEFLDEKGLPVSFGANGLKDLRAINCDNVMPQLKDCKFNVACDVKNPLCGENGCSEVFSPQKGADFKMVKDMDNWMSKYAKLTKTIIPSANENLPGCGAAGGLGYAFTTYLGGTLNSGVELILKKMGIENDIRDADFVITGEGKLDSQTIMGKVPVGVAKFAKKYDKTVIAFAGGTTKEAEECNNYGIDAFFSILNSVCTMKEAMDKNNASENMKSAVKQVFRLIKSI